MTQLRDKADLKVVGTRPNRPDGPDKVTGKATYGADVTMPGMLFGKIKRSPHAHARILGIDTRKARALPGVKAIVTGDDLPLPKSENQAGGEGGININHLAQVVLARGKVLYEGQAVAAVAATSNAIAEEACRLIEIRYEVLPHVTTIEAATAPGAPVLHDDLPDHGAPNIAAHHEMARGDADAGLARADVVVDRHYTTQGTHQGYIEPHACVASVAADGQATIWSSSQGPFMVRQQSAELSGIPLGDIRAIPAEIGGGFGGKTLVYLEPVALALSQRSGRPVKLVMSRDEVFRATGPTSGAVMDVRIGATRDGKITGAKLDIRFQAGAFPGSPIGTGLMTAVTAYDVPDFRLDGWDVVTNTPKTAAYRAPGAPIIAFAVESALDELAAKLGIDPLELRRRNAVENGMQAAYGPVFENIGFVETLDAVAAHPHLAAPLGPNQGRGVAAGFWFNIGGDSSAMVSINEDGSATVATGNPDIGGSRASMAMMAAEVLGLPIGRVRAIVADTSSIGYCLLTAGSRTTFATGMAVTRAAEKVVEEMKARAALTWGVDVANVAWEDGMAVCTDPAVKEAPLPLATIAAQSSMSGGPISAEVALNAQGAAATFGIHVCDVEVDPETGQVTVLRYTAAQEVGRAIHPSYVEGQVQGGAAQGIGWALNEEYLFDADGRMENPGFLDYRMPVASDLPMIDAVLVEVPNPNHPFGAKGVGEVSIVPPLGAVANAVSNAIGKRVTDLPLSPPRLWAKMNSGD